MRRIKIFLASSSSLKDEREQFEIMMARLSSKWLNKNIFFELIVWEHFLDAMSAQRMQGEYNKSVASADIFVMLFFTKVGIYTQEEFETAFQHFQKNGQPRIYTYFKNAQVFIADLVESDTISLFNFKRRLQELGHFHTNYVNVEDLKFQFNTQLEMLIDKGLVGAGPGIEPLLKKELEAERDFCRQNNIYIYTASLLRACLQNSQGAAFSCFDHAKKEYPQLLLVKLAAIIQQGLVTERKGKPFEEQDWMARPEFVRAQAHAENENAAYITEKHLLLGMMEQSGNTVQMIRKDLTEQGWQAFMQCLQNGNQSPTPPPTFM